MGNDEGPDQTGGHFVFIGYGRDDASEFAAHLADDLKKRGGHQVWFDAESIEQGAPWEVRIESGLRHCTILVAVMTRRSVEPDSVCRDEVVYAINEGKPVIPLRFDPTAKPTLLLTRLNWIDFTQDRRLVGKSEAQDARGRIVCGLSRIRLWGSGRQ